MSVRRIRGRWHVDIGFQGRRIRRASPHNTKRGALDYEATLRKRLARGEPLDQKEVHVPTLKEYAPVWLATHAYANNKPSEIATKRRILSNHLIPAFGARQLDQIRPAQIEAFKATKRGKLADKTINNILGVLRTCLTSAEDAEIVESTPRIRPIRCFNEPPKTLREDHVQALLRDREEGHFDVMIRMAVRAGLRLGEMIGLQWDDVDLARGRITVRHTWWRGHLTSPKGARTRIVPLSADLARELEQLPKTRAWVFPNQKGAPLTPAVPTRALKRACARQGVPVVGFHALRHTFATLCCAKGVPVPTVQRLLGHADIKTTMRYVHVNDEQLYRAVQQAAEPWPRAIYGNIAATEPELGVSEASADVSGAPPRGFAAPRTSRVA